jgi:small subunit ribosomal protein S8e
MVYILLLYSGKTMALWQGSSQRSKTGRHIRFNRGKRRFEIGREVHEATIGKPSVKAISGRANISKFAVKTTNIAYVLDPKTHKATKTEIITVVDNPANINYIRRNIITKGAVLNTPLGHARVTSRPGQTGVVHAVLMIKEGK